MTVWPLVPLGEVLVEQKERIGTIDADGLPLLGVSNKDGLHRSGMPRIPDMSRYLRVEREWFAYNPMRVNVGSIGWAHSDNLAGVISPDYVVFSCTPKILPQLLYWFLTSGAGLQAINFQTAGSVRERLYFASLARVTLPLPPIEEQQRLVGRIEKLSSSTNKAKLLHHQSCGQSSTLLDSYIAAAFNEADKHGWKQYNLGDFVTEARYGTSEKTTDDPSGTPTLRMGNIQGGSLVTQDLKYLHLSNADRAMLVLRHGDIVVNRTNSAELVGKCAVFRLEREFAFASYLIRLRIDASRAIPDLLAAYINSSAGRAYMFAERKQMTGQANVNTQKLRMLPIRLPALEEQGELLNRIEKLRSFRQRLHSQQNLVNRELEALLPSILNRAFSGEL